MNIEVGKYIYLALQGISRSLSVYPVTAYYNTDTPALPFCVYQRTGMSPQCTKDLYDKSITHTYSVIMADSDYSDCAAHADSAINVLLALSHVEENDMYINQVTVTDLYEDYIDGIFTQTIQIEINTTEK